MARQAEKRDRRTQHRGTQQTLPSRATTVAKTTALQDKFLDAYVAVGTVYGAGKSAGIPRERHYGWLKIDEEYARRFASAHEEAVDRAEQELRRRGVVGYEKPIYQGGKLVGMVREYSDACLIFYLKGRRRDVFGDKQELTGRDGMPLQMNTNIMIVQYGADDHDARTPPD